jgi:hypothetical protein
MNTKSSILAKRGELRAAYLREHIHLDLGDREKQGIARFVECLRAVTGETVYEPKYIAGF